MNTLNIKQNMNTSNLLVNIENNQHKLTKVPVIIIFFMVCFLKWDLQKLESV